MKDADSFVTSKKFYGEEHYPYGISRSGEFNRGQSVLLEDHGTAYQALASGQKAPGNEEERDFVLVCKGEKPAQTKHETTWMRYCEKTQKRSSTPAFTGRPSAHDIGNFPSSDEEW